MASPWEKSQFVKRLAECEALRGLPAKTQLMIISHAAFESGWGVALASKYGNVFNVTAGSSWKGPTTPGPDMEYKDGVAKHITQQWRVYDSLNDAVADYLRLLEKPRYTDAKLALLDGKPEDFIEHLHAGGYFTLSPREYLRVFLSVLAQVTSIVDVPPNTNSKA